MSVFRYLDENLKDKWKGINDNVPVNDSMYVFVSRDEEKKFVENMFPTKDQMERYKKYREEWYRRAKKFEYGDYPLSINCELVSTCNLACTMCYTITDKFQNSVIGAQRIMPWHQVKNIIDECAELKVPSISFSWRGESTMYRSKDENGKVKDFADVLKYARDKGILEITSLTHGQLIDEKMAKKIVEAEPSWISFSIDGMEKKYNSIRTPANKLDDSSYNAFERVSHSIKLLVKYKKILNKSRPSIRTNSIFPAIQEDPNAYQEYMRKIGVDFITVNELKDYRFHRLSDEQIQDNWACQYPFQRLTISSNGTILPCTGAYNEEIGLVLGKFNGSPVKVVRDIKGKVVKQNLNEFSIYNVWHSDKLNNIRYLHKNKRRKEIEPGCRNCHHGAVHHGADYMPKEWDKIKQRWVNHKILSEKRKYKLRGN